MNPVANANGPSMPTQRGRRTLRRRDRLQPQPGLLRQLPRRPRQPRADRARQDHGLHRALGMRQEHRAAQPQPHERPDPGLPLRGPRPVPRPGRLRARGGSRRGAPVHRHGLPAAQPVLDEHLRQRGLRAPPQPLPRQRRRAGRAGPAAGGALGRGQGQAQEQRAVAVGRPAAAPVHRPRHRHRTLGAPDGRAVLRPRSDRHPAHRGADGPAQGELHDRHRHPQHAAGPAGGRHHGVLLGGHLQGQPHRAISSSPAPPGSCSRTRGSSSPRSTSRASSARATGDGGVRSSDRTGLAGGGGRRWPSCCPPSARIAAGRDRRWPRSWSAAPGRRFRRRSTRSGSRPFGSRTRTSPSRTTWWAAARARSASWPTPSTSGPATPP